MSRRHLQVNARRLVTPAIWLVAALAIVAALVRVSGVDAAGVLAAMHRLPVWAWPAIALTQGVIIAFAALKWRLLLAGTSPELPRLGPGAATSATALGTLAGQVMPIHVVTPILRARAARRHGIPVPVALGTSVLEQVFEVIALVAFGAVSALFLTLPETPTVVLLPALVFVMLIMTVLVAATRGIWRLAGRLATIGASHSSGRMADSLGALARGLDAAAALAPRTLALLVALSALRFVLLAGLSVGVLCIVLPEVSAASLILAFPLVLLINALPVFPGGLGVVELTWTGTLVAAGVPLGASVVAALALRVISTVGFIAALPVLLVPLALSPAPRPLVTA